MNDTTFRCDIVNALGKIPRDGRECTSLVKNIARALGVSVDVCPSLYSTLREGEYAKIGSEDLSTLLREGKEEHKIIVFVAGAGRYLRFNSLDDYKKYWNDPAVNSNGLTILSRSPHYQILSAHEKQKFVIFAADMGDTVAKIKKHAKRIFGKKVTTCYHGAVDLEQIVVDIPITTFDDYDATFYKLISDAKMQPIMQHIVMPAYNVDLISNTKYFMYALRGNKMHSAPPIGVYDAVDVNSSTQSRAEAFIVARPPQPTETVVNYYEEYRRVQMAAHFKYVHSTLFDRLVIEAGYCTAALTCDMLVRWEYVR